MRARMSSSGQGSAQSAPNASGFRLASHQVAPARA